MEPNTFEFSHVILPRLLSSRKTSRDPRDIRLAAVTSAIVETANERRAQSPDGANKSDKVTASEIYAVTLTALEGTITSSVHSDDSPQFPLLQILENTIPHVPPSFFVSQFNLLSRLLRAITTATKGAGFIADMDTSNTNTNMETKDELGGQNAKLRQIIKTSKQSLFFFLVNEDSIDGVGGGGEKDKAIIKLLDGTLMALFHDKRPKVRKLAHASVLELLAEEDGGEGSMDASSSSSVLLRSHIGDYIRAVLSHYEEKQQKKKKHKQDEADNELMIKMMHLMQFCEGVCKYIPAKFQICEDAVKLIVSIMMGMSRDEVKNNDKVFGAGNHKGNDENKQAKIMLVNSLLTVLISIIDVEEEGQLDADMEVETPSSNKRKELAGKTLASLIQLSSLFKSSMFSNSSADEALDEYKVRQAQLIVSCCIVLRGTTPGLKLLPVAMTIITNFCDSNTSGTACIQSCSSELQRMIRSCVVVAVSDSNNDVGEDTVKNCAVACNECISKLLHHRFRPYWDIILPAYALFITQIGNGGKLEDIVKPLLLSLVDSHGNVTDDSSVKAIENTVGNVIQGLGIEVFWKYVPLDGGNAAGSENKNVLTNASKSNASALLFGFFIL